MRDRRAHGWMNGRTETPGGGIDGWDGWMDVKHDTCVWCIVHAIVVCVCVCVCMCVCICVYVYVYVYV